MILATLNVIAPVADPSPSDGIAMAGLRQIFLGQNCRNNCTQGQYWGMSGAQGNYPVLRRGEQPRNEILRR